MKAVLVLVCVLAVAHGITAPECPTAGVGTPVSKEIYPFYKYNWEMPKNSAEGTMFVTVDSVDRATQGLWIRINAESLSSQTASMNMRLTVNRTGTMNDTIWQAFPLSTGSENHGTGFGLPTSFVNITLGDKLWLTVFPACSGCSETVEFSIETAWYIGSTSNYPNITLVNNTRTMVFEEPQGSYLTFTTTVVGSAFFYTSVVFDETATTGSSEIVLYWTKDTPYTGNGTFLYVYPDGDGIITGNYLTSRPFTANTSGTYFLSTFVKTGATGVNNDPEFTIKVGFNSVPCSSGSVLSISLFLAILPFLASLWN
jgi:hypothetical protein